MRKQHMFFLSMIFLMLPLESSAQQYGLHETQLLFEAGTNNYFTYRIASLVSTQKGTLLAFCSARKGRQGRYEGLNVKDTT